MIVVDITDLVCAYLAKEYNVAENDVIIDRIERPGTDDFVVYGRIYPEMTQIEMSFTL